jgi:ankyrin repeat protein
MNAELLDAVRENRAVDVRRLLMNGADANARNIFAETALMYAAHNGNVTIMLMLMNRGARLEDEDRTGSTALLWAAVGLSADALQLLIERGANVNAQDVDGFSAIEWVIARDGLNLFHDAPGLHAIQELILGGASFNNVSKRHLLIIYSRSGEDVRQIIDDSGRELWIEPEMEDF